MNGEKHNMLENICNYRGHDWEYTLPMESMGPGLLGNIVACMGQDMVCKVCGTTSWRRIVDDEMEKT